MYEEHSPKSVCQMTAVSEAQRNRVRSNPECCVTSSPQWHKVNTVPFCLETRLPSNLRRTTRECVYLVRRGHFRSRDRDASHTIRSTIARNPMPHANLAALSSIEPDVMPNADRSFILREYGFFALFSFCNLTLTLTR